MINKRGFEFSFGWMFAIIVGAAFLFLAIYGATKLMSGEKQIQNTELAAQFNALLSPLETNVEEEKSVPPLVFPSESRINNSCDSSGFFGEQKFYLSIKSGVGKAWDGAGVVKTNNKYVFSSPFLEGKEMHLFTKRLDLPFKVADLIFMLSPKDQFCFVNAPSQVKEDFEKWNIQNINLSSSTHECGKASKKVCFASSGCDIDVSLSSKSVTKNLEKQNKTVYYEGFPLMYAAIFSDNKGYECQLARLIKRTEKISQLYSKKAILIGQRGCNSGGNSEMISQIYNFASSLNSYRSSIDLRQISLLANQIGEKNENLICKLF